MQIEYQPCGFYEKYRQEVQQRRTQRIVIFLLTVSGLFLAATFIWSAGDFLTFAVTPRSRSCFPDCSGIPDPKKFDCHPDLGVTRERCLKRGCCFQAPSEDFPPLNVPYCYFPESYGGYEISDIHQEANEVRASLKRKIPFGFPSDVQELNLLVQIIDDYSLRVKVTDANTKRFEVPILIKDTPKPLEDMIYTVNFTYKGIFTITRKSTGKVIFLTDFSQMIYSDQFLQLSTDLPSPYIYGLGEHYGSFLRSVNWTRFTLFNSDRGPMPNYPIYGSQPFYLSLEEDGNSNGVFLLNSNAMDIILQPKPAVTFRPIGGILDFFILLGPTPANVVQQFTAIVGRSFMPPYWSLGFHLCRWGYYSVNKTREVLQRNLDAGVQVQIQWNDIDYMDQRKDFTYDTKNFAGLPEFVNELHEKGMYYVAMTDPALSASEPQGTYPPYEEGMKQDVFIKNPDGSVFQAKVWTKGDSVFPDFSHPNAEAFWTKQITDFHSKVKFDGLWLDMNEPSNFVDGQKDGCISSIYEDPYYVPTGDIPLRHKTVCMTAKHSQTIHYNEHNLYAYREVNVTNKALQAARNKRAFIISRATFLGQGSLGGHWSGDIASSWEDMRYSISSMLSFNLYGISMTGSDICGFVENATVELCARWQALGAFYPFSRNHNDKDAVAQDPASMGPVVVNATVNALDIRYPLLPYLYTLFYRSYVYGDTVARPLFFEYPQDENTYVIEEQFLWGPALMILPVLYPNASSVTAYFPDATWYLMTSGLKVSGKVTIPSDVSQIQLALRGGHVIPGLLQNFFGMKNVFLLYAVLDENQTAAGELYWDDGDSSGTYENEKYNLIKFTVANNIFVNKVLKSGYSANMTAVVFLVLGVVDFPTTVTVNGVDCYIKRDMNIDSADIFHLLRQKLLINSFYQQGKTGCTAVINEKGILVITNMVSLLFPFKIVWN